MPSYKPSHVIDKLGLCRSVKSSYWILKPFADVGSLTNNYDLLHTPRAIITWLCKSAWNFECTFFFVILNFLHVVRNSTSHSAARFWFLSASISRNILIRIHFASFTNLTLFLVSSPVPSVTRFSGMPTLWVNSTIDFEASARMVIGTTRLNFAFVKRLRM